MDFVKDGQLCISPDEWAALNTLYSKDVLIDLLSASIENHNLELPYREITKQEALDDFLALKNVDCLLKEGNFYSRYAYKYPFSNLYIDNSKVGNKSSDLFHQVNRFRCDSINSPSPYRVWTTDKFRKSLFNSLWTLKVKEINNTVLRSCIGLRKYIASQFRPSAAKTIYDYFEAKDVLDFSMGWGDRLAGFCASANTKSYVGIDPNINLFDGYEKQVKFYNTDKQIKFFNSAAEDFNFSEYIDRFDLIFSSPPYYCAERYSQADNQSWKRYKKLDEWLEKFLFSVIRNTANTLKVGGYLVINISDVYLHHERNEICNPMNDFISMLNFEYKGAVGLKMAKRPNSNANGAGIFAEPIWIWQKTC
jgi:16S rRNA G966 N2-methylase RsmD